MHLKALCICLVLKAYWKQKVITIFNPSWSQIWLIHRKNVFEHEVYFDIPLWHKKGDKYVNYNTLNGLLINIFSSIV